MTKQYNDNIHTHVTFNVPLTQIDADVWNGTFAIVLHTSKHVWIPASYMHLDDGAKELGVKQCGCGEPQAFGPGGECIVAVPVEFVRAYLTEAEAEPVEEMVYADQALMGYAS